MSELKYIISHDQLMDLILEKDTTRRVALIKEIVKNPYREKTGWEYAAGGIGKILKEIDDLTGPEQKKKGRS